MGKSKQWQVLTGLLNVSSCEVNAVESDSARFKKFTAHSYEVPKRIKNIENWRLYKLLKNLPIDWMHIDCWDNEAIYNDITEVQKSLREH